MCKAQLTLQTQNFLQLQHTTQDMLIKVTTEFLMRKAGDDNDNDSYNDMELQLTNYNE